jgi:hypothetical protein
MVGYHCILIRENECDITKHLQACGTSKTLLHCLWKRKMINHFSTVWQFLIKLNIHLLYDPVVPFLGMHAREMSPKT